MKPSVPPALPDEEDFISRKSISFLTLFPFLLSSFHSLLLAYILTFRPSILFTVRVSESISLGFVPLTGTRGHILAIKKCRVSRDAFPDG
jgi:hypothetical protein